MTDIQEKLISAGLISAKKINMINRQKAVEEALERVSKKINSGKATPDDWAKYAQLKRRAPRNLKFAY